MVKFLLLLLFCFCLAALTFSLTTLTKGHSWRRDFLSRGWSMLVQSTPQVRVKVPSRKGLEARETVLEVVLQSCSDNGTDVACHHKRRRRSRDSDVEVADDTEVIRGDSAGHRV